MAKTRQSTFLRDDDKDPYVQFGNDGPVPSETHPAADVGDGTDNRTKWAGGLVKRHVRDICKEYSKHKKTKPDEYTYEIYKRNQDKNRYNDIICIDSTRVVLKEREEGKDYIHASWMTMPDGYKYICTQGPLAETVEDFWHMIATENCTVIVMLCALHEGGNSKCDRYYPKPKTTCAAGASFKIRYVEKKDDIAEGVTKHIYELQNKGKNTQIIHYQCPVWNDHLAPSDPDCVIKLLRAARQDAKDTPMVVHCSAGIGRTSTFVGIDYANQKIKENANYTIVECLKDLRTMRFQAIQGPVQYLFLHVAIMEHFAQCDIIKKTEGYKAFMKSYQKALEKYEKKASPDAEEKKKTKSKSR